jgi:hypothetical protein
MTIGIFGFLFRFVAWLSSGIAHGLTEAFRFSLRLVGIDVEPRLICLNSVCALPVSTLPIDSSSFQRILELGTRTLVWLLLAIVLLVALQALIRAILGPDSPVTVFLRQLFTVKRVLIALGLVVAAAALVAVLGNIPLLGNITSPYSGME